MTGLASRAHFVTHHNSMIDRVGVALSGRELVVGSTTYGLIDVEKIGYK